MARGMNGIDEGGGMRSRLATRHTPCAKASGMSTRHYIYCEQEHLLGVLPRPCTHMRMQLRPPPPAGIAVEPAALRWPGRVKRSTLRVSTYEKIPDQSAPAVARGRAGYIGPILTF
jgi:hypothetical protein